MRKVSVVIPSRDRPEGLLRAVESVLTTAPDAEIVCVLDGGDTASARAVGGMVPWLVFNHDPDAHTAQLWNMGAKKATGDYLVTGADDVVFQPGWLEAAFEALDMIGGDGLVGFNEGTTAFGELATHFMVSRKYAARGLGGSLMPPPYKHGFTDVEATLRAKRDGRLVFAENARIEHLHPVFGTAEMDDIYRKGDRSVRDDERLFKLRMKNNFPDDFERSVECNPADGWGSIAVGLRTYKGVDSVFMQPWSRFLMTGLRVGDKLLDIDKARGKMHHIAANALVVEFLKTDCDSLLLVDDDMIMPHDALSLMRDNKKGHAYDISQGFCTFKSFPPHAVAYKLSDSQPQMPGALAGLNYNALAHLPDNDVTEVDAVGIAFTLIKRRVLEQMISEHGAEWTVWFDTGGHSETEDMRFSSRCREAGFSMCVDTHAKIGHVGSHVYGWPEHQQYVKLLEKSYG